ncbi:MAG: RidA family protein [Proteobacteria bacterium]|nr:RidA family protein [Pseudomonadota bacterium]
MKLVAHDPTEGIFPTTEDYIHGLEVQQPERFLFVSGTIGLDENSAAGKSVEQQLDLIWSNIKIILNSAHMTTNNIVRITSYLRDRQFADANQDARMAALGDHRVPTTAIIAETLESDWLVEVEVIAAG